MPIYFRRPNFIGVNYELTLQETSRRYMIKYLLFKIMIAMCESNIFFSTQKFIDLLRQLYLTFLGDYLAFQNQMVVVS